MSRYIRWLVRLPLLVLALPIISIICFFGWVFDDDFKLSDVTDSDYWRAFKP